MGDRVARRVRGIRLENPRKMKVPKLFTIGYACAAGPSELVARLQAAGVERVVDVRELPLSRRRGFSKQALAAALAEGGIVYEHVRALGNPKLHRDRYKAGDVTGGARAYRAHLHNGSHSALVELADSLSRAKTCLLCVESEHDTCHRAVIAGAIAERLPRVAIVHL
jgi:uncharacterized protein (DUF488 family)